ncbi:MAG TPA: hypothetical protein VIL32_05605, partial [Steroidobacteraceae bacterium]
MRTLGFLIFGSVADVLSRCTTIIEQNVAEAQPARLPMQGEIMRSKSMRLICLAGLAVSAAVPLAAAPSSTEPQCTDPVLGKVDCVPETFTTFDIPFDKLPGGRMDASGSLNRKSSPKD